MGFCITLEPIDIENDEYLYWDANGRSVRISISGKQVTGIEYGAAEMPLAEGFRRHSDAFGLHVDTAGPFDQLWHRVEEAKSRLPRRKALLSKLFRRGKT